MEILKNYLDPHKGEACISGVFADISEAYTYLDMTFEKLRHFNGKEQGFLDDRDLEKLLCSIISEDDIELAKEYFDEIPDEIKEEYCLEPQDDIYYSSKILKESREYTNTIEKLERYGIPVEVNHTDYIDRFFLDTSNFRILDDDENRTLVFMNVTDAALIDFIEKGYDVVNKPYFKYGSIPREKYLRHNDYIYK